MVSETDMFVPLGGAISLPYFIPSGQTSAVFTLNPLSSEASSVFRFVLYNK